jgi:hypothetical protein
MPYFYGYSRFNLGSYSYLCLHIPRKSVYGEHEKSRKIRTSLSLYQNKLPDSVSEFVSLLKVTPIFLGGVEEVI